MSNGTVVAVVAVVGLVLTLVGLWLGVPAWRLSKHAVRAQAASDEQARLTAVVAKVLGGTTDPGELSPEHPSVVDAIKDVREAVREVSATQSVLAFHIADGHGGRIPPHVLKF